LGSVGAPAPDPKLGSFRQIGRTGSALGSLGAIGLDSLIGFVSSHADVSLASVGAIRWGLEIGFVPSPGVAAGSYTMPLLLPCNRHLETG
jgi:hypothetical protein